ncbi:hypothetical protein RCL1_002755 [Eukaryota sp. TZLM3-RCL]
MTDDRISKTTLPQDSHWTQPLSPLSVFSELFSTLIVDNQPIVALNSDPKLESIISDLDRIPHFEVHKIGMLYIKPGQKSLIESLKNTTSLSPRFTRFITSLGRIVDLTDCAGMYTGGLDCSTLVGDGRFALMRMTPLSHIVFHVASLMPNKENDEKCNAKNRHIGNDFVVIVYCESESTFDHVTMSAGDFNWVFIVISALDSSKFKVNILISDRISNQITSYIRPLVDQHVLSYDTLIPFVAQMATVFNRFCNIYQSVLDHI